MTAAASSDHLTWECHVARPANQNVLAITASSTVARVYLLVVFGLLVWVGIDAYAVDHADASFAAVFPVIATLPLSLFVIVVPDFAVLYLVVIVIAALANAILLAHLARARQHRAE
ncbi:SCO4225 family membrane protein [Streptomyces olivaceoviridis]|uniref:SCO4225 family membrane protein n=1 Tax=Streptomyces olivaceoviridis TaxID=1921 RepID=UPI0036A7AD5B